MQQFEKLKSGPIATVVFCVSISISGTAVAQDSNACPVDGCVVDIVSVTQDNGELTVELNANFKPDISKNHFHIWWGELYDVRQVSNNAETVHNVSQGDWHPTDAYPTYATSGVTSVLQRGEAVSLCVSAADRNHDIIDPEALNCVDVSNKF
ncbi:hypothetical protein [Sulfitobacter sp. JB4-11]|uniref:hypothetical protein n=1 Tax=Sulfitobacter rhodophyticola TaxID=3238304 RepID=UPI003514B21A